MSKAKEKEHGDCYERLVELVRFFHAYPDWTTREIAKGAHMAPQTAERYQQLLARTTVPMEDLLKMTGRELYAALNSTPRGPRRKQRPDLEAVVKQLINPATQRPRKGRSRWKAYKECIEHLSEQEHQNFVGYTQFNKLLRQLTHSAKAKHTIEHEPGMVCQVDFSGPGTTYFSKKGPVGVQLFVGVLPCSGYLFATAVPGQTTEDILGAMTEMVGYFGGVPQVILSDNWAGGVSHAGPVPEFTRPYMDWMRHHRVAPHATRVASPTDKGAAENAVAIAQNALLRSLERLAFFSLEELNAAIRVLMDARNDEAFWDPERGGTRREAFERKTRPALRPLPMVPFEVGELSAPQTVEPRHWVYCKGNRYSVPHQLVGKTVRTRCTPSAIEIWHDGQRVASHERLPTETGEPKTATLREHLPSDHQYALDRNITTVLAWAKDIGPHTVEFLRCMLDTEVPLLKFADAWDVRHAAKGLTSETVEAACADATKTRQLSAKGFRTALAHLKRDNAAKPRFNIPGGPGTHGKGGTP
jgi:transposase